MAGRLKMGGEPMILPSPQSFEELVEKRVESCEPAIKQESKR